MADAFRHKGQRGTAQDQMCIRDRHLVGLSALMTTTLKSMEETIAALHEAGLDCKIMGSQGAKGSSSRTPSRWTSR